MRRFHLLPRPPRRASLLGVPIDRCSLAELRLAVRRALASGRVHRIVTVNPEIVLTAWEDPRYGAALRTADLVTIDGTGVLLALRVRYGIRSERVSGSMVLEELCATAAAEDVPVTFILRSDGLTTPSILHDTLQRRWPDLRSSIAAIDPAQALEPSLRQAITDAHPGILIVNFGHPEQEFWITAHVNAFPSIRIALAVGGAVDYLTGTATLPPAFLRRAGLEWAWRLARQPWRVRRIIRATVKFPLAVCAETLRSLRPSLRAS